MQLTRSRGLDQDKALVALLAPRLLVVDIECTCGLGVDDERAVQELIEFGWCIDGPEQAAVAGSQRSAYVRPVNTPVNEFCERLTGIEGGRLRDEPVFSVRMEWLQRMLDAEKPSAWASWGEFDAAHLERQCEREKVVNPLAPLPHVNVKRALATRLSRMVRARGRVFPPGAKRGVGLERALGLLGMPFVGRPHSGADDALNIARVLQLVRSECLRLN